MEKKQEKNKISEIWWLNYKDPVLIDTLGAMSKDLNQHLKTIGTDKIPIS